MPFAEDFNDARSEFDEDTRGSNENVQVPGDAVLEGMLESAITVMPRLREALEPVQQVSANALEGELRRVRRNMVFCSIDTYVSKGSRELPTEVGARSGAPEGPRDREPDDEDCSAQSRGQERNQPEHPGPDRGPQGNNQGGGSEVSVLVWTLSHPRHIQSYQEPTPPSG